MTANKYTQEKKRDNSDRCQNGDAAHSSPPCFLFILPLRTDDCCPPQLCSVSTQERTCRDPRRIIRPNISFSVNAGIRFTSEDTQ